MLSLSQYLLVLNYYSLLLSTPQYLLITTVSTRCLFITTVSTRCLFITTVNTRCLFITTVNTRCLFITTINTRCLFITTVNTRCLFITTINKTVPSITELKISYRNFKAVQRLPCEAKKQTMIYIDLFNQTRVCSFKRSHLKSPLAEFLFNHIQLSTYEFSKKLFFQFFF